MDESNELAGHERTTLISEPESAVEHPREPAPMRSRSRQRAGTWVLWALWVLLFTVGGFVGLQVAWANRVRAGGIVEWTIAGAVLGLAQWPVLSRYVPKITWWTWIPATAVGLIAGIMATGAWIAAMPGGLEIPGAPVVNAAIDGGIALAGVGIAQWLVLRLHVRSAGWWVLSNVLAGALLQPIIFLTTLQLGGVLYKIFSANVTDAPKFGDGASQALAVAGSVGQVLGLIAAGAVTGLALVRLLRQPALEAAGAVNDSGGEQALPAAPPASLIPPSPKNTS
jgi:hypothetical protein